MCYYIKDNGKQCGMEEEPYCRHHRDTVQGELYRRTVEEYGELENPTTVCIVWKAVEDTIEERFSEEAIKEALSDGSDSVVSGSYDVEMDTLCDHCETFLRRTERLREHSRQGRRLVFEAVVKCDCSEHVIDATSVREGELPLGWR